MSLSDVLQIKTWLKAQHITISTEWIQACIEFIKEEQHARNLTLTQLKNSIYEQWLAADLEEIGISSLPVDLQSVGKITLKGTFALQVNGLRDISKPAYTQLKEFEGTANDNTEVSATPQASLPEWEAKPTRMLMLNLTDGCSHIQGMEYKTIRFLSPNLPPGVKVLVKGPVDCRFGLLMLTAENFKILGGEVESNLRKYSREAILKNILHLPSSENDASCNNNQHIDENSAPDINPEIQDVNRMPISHNVTSHSRTSFNLNKKNSTSDNSQQHQQTITYNRTNYASSSRDNHEIADKNNHSARFNKASTSYEDQFSDDLDQFENDDDDFVQNLDFCSIDEIERNSQRSSEKNDVFEDWQDDEDVMQDLMSFQESRPEVQLPFPDLEKVNNHAIAKSSKCSGIDSSVPFTYISSISKLHYKELLVTIKGFIITVASKLACTVNDGWQLTVKINDGTDSIDADIHNQVLESFIGISAKNVIETQEQASENVEKLKKIKEAVSNCKLKLQNLNCLMDIKFSNNARPCIVKCFSIERLHLEQLLERVRANT